MTENVKALKGNLESSGHIKNNLIYKENLYTTHQVYDRHHAIIKIIAKALEIVKSISLLLYGYLNSLKLVILCNEILQTKDND